MVGADHSLLCLVRRDGNYSRLIRFGGTIKHEYLYAHAVYIRYLLPILVPGTQHCPVLSRTQNRVVLSAAPWQTEAETGTDSGRGSIGSDHTSIP